VDADGDGDGGQLTAIMTLMTMVVLITTNTVMTDRSDSLCRVSLVVICCQRDQPGHLRVASDH
jgi:hypothetical protein